MAVYTKISHNELESLLNNYNIGDLISFTGIAEGIQNSNYLIQTSKAKYIFTIYEKKVKSEDLPFFLQLVQHLAKNGIPCPLPVEDINGNIISNIAGKPCSIVSFLNGCEPKNINTAHLSQLGENIARMHVAGRDFKLVRQNELSIAGWLEIYNKIENGIDGIIPGIKNELKEMLTFLQEHWPQKLPSGIIHADIFPDNVFFDKDKLVGIIDFYFACNDFLAYELAICINSWCFDNNETYNQGKVNSLISSYSKVRELSREELENLPVLTKGAAMRFFLTRMYDNINIVDGAVVKLKNPMEYWNKLRFHFKDN